MLIFKDSATGKVWQYEDDVIVVDTGGVYTFFQNLGTVAKPVKGAQLNAPTTLQPYTPPAVTTAEQLAAAQAAQIAIIEAACTSALDTPMSFTNAAGTTSSFPMSQYLWTKYHLAMTNYVLNGVALPAGFSFYDENGVAVPMTVADIKAFFEQAVAAGDTAEQKQATLIAEIMAATTVSAVQAITW